jgi:hypothetical protein
MHNIHRNALVLVSSEQCLSLVFMHSVSNTKVKVKFTLVQATKAQRYSTTDSLALALDGGGWLTPHLSCFTPGKEIQYPLYRQLCGPQGGSGQVQKTCPSSGLGPWTVQPVMSRYTDYTILAHQCLIF